MGRKIDIFVFDWSGVISNDKRPVYESNMRLLKDFEKPVMSFEEFFKNTQLNAALFLKSQGVWGDYDELLRRYKKYYDDVNKEGIVPVVYSDAYDVLSFLKERGKRICVLSSHPEENLIREAEKYNVKKFLDFIEGGLKEKAGGLKELCELFNIWERRMLYTGDTIYDIRHAKQARVLSAGICTGYHSRERLDAEEPDFLFDDLSDIKKKVIDWKL